jgi:hypothetical protein
MEIGKPLRTIFIELLQPPADKPDTIPPEPTAQPEPEPEKESAQ